MSDLTDRFDELRREGLDALAAVAAIESSTGIDRDTLRRQLARSLNELGRNPERELIKPLSRLSRQPKTRRGSGRRTTVRLVPARPASEWRPPEDEAA